jgi:hypothetical protein
MEVLDRGRDVGNDEGHLWSRYEVKDDDAGVSMEDKIR